MFGQRSTMTAIVLVVADPRIHLLLPKLCFHDGFSLIRQPGTVGTSPQTLLSFCSVQEQEVEILPAYFVEVIKSPIDPNTYLIFITACITSTVPGNRARIRFLLATDPLWWNNT